MPARRPSTRDRIVREAFALVRREGVEQLTLRRLAERVGVTAPALYRHFSDKAALLGQLAAEANEELSGYLRGAPLAGEPIDRLRAVCAAYLRFASDRPLAYEILFLGSSRRDLETPPTGARSANFRLFLDRVEEVGHSLALGSDWDAVTVAITFWCWLDGLASLIRQGRFRKPGRDLDRVFAGGFALLAHGLKPPPT